MTAGISFVLAVDTPIVTLAEAEHSLLGLGSDVALPDDVFVCTHEVRDGTPHYAFSISFGSAPPAGLLRVLADHLAGKHLEVVRSGGVSDRPAAPVGAQHALDQAWARDGGRAVRFPGSRDLVGTQLISRAIEGSALDQVVVLGGSIPEDGDVLHTRDFLRPLWRRGELVLPVLPAGAHAFAPFEVPNPTPCCAAHS